MADPAWLDRKALAERYSLHDKRAVRRLERLGKLPKPSYHLGPRNPRWRTLEVDRLFLGEKQAPREKTARELLPEIVADVLKGRI